MWVLSWISVDRVCYLSDSQTHRSTLSKQHRSLKFWKNPYINQAEDALTFHSALGFRIKACIASEIWWKIPRVFTVPCQQQQKRCLCV